MRVSDVRLRTSAHECQLEATIQIDGQTEPFELWYRFPREFARFVNPNSGNPFVAALLPAAMKLGVSLEISAPVSRKLLAATEEV